MIPLILKLKKTSHKEIAKAQDMIVEQLYKVFDNAVLHGGTCIWRCFDGNRFSEDLDVYLPLDRDKVDMLFENIAKRGFVVLKKKIGEKSIYSALKLDRAVIRFEAVFRKIDGFLCEYKTIDGNLITIYTLTSEELVKEKLEAYTNRRKVRDLYDIFFLLRYVKEKSSVRHELQRFMKHYNKPIDEKELKVLIIEGLAPESKKMIDYIKYWLK